MELCCVQAGTHLFVRLCILLITSHLWMLVRRLLSIFAWTFCSPLSTIWRLVYRMLVFSILLSEISHLMFIALGIGGIMASSEFLYL